MYINEIRKSIIIYILFYRLYIDFVLVFFFLLFCFAKFLFYKPILFTRVRISFKEWIEISCITVDFEAVCMKVYFTCAS